MDKIRLFCSHRTIPKHIFTQRFINIGNKAVGKKGLKIYFYYDREAGVKITDTPKGISLECNPTKFVNGNNIYQIDRKGLIDFTHQISKLYETDLGVWDVSMFDFNSDLEVDRIPNRYFKNLGSLKNWHVKEYDKTGRNYHTKSNSKAITFYNLPARLKYKNELVPTCIQNKNIIRIESSFNKELQKNKELKNMKTLNDYTQLDNYMQLPKIWLNTYELVEKNELVTFDNSNLTNKEQGVVALIEKYTLNGYREKLRLDNPKNYRYANEQLIKLLGKVRSGENKKIINEISELNYKVRERAKQLIALA